MTRLFSLAFAAFSLILISAAPASAEFAYEERVIGDPNAPVTIIEYSSFTCPHCASFHNNTLPTLKKEYIDTGKVRLIYRDFPFERVGATASMLARCVPEQRFEGFVNTLFKTQAQWTAEANPVAGMARIARLAGMSEENIQACLQTEPLINRIIEVRQEATTVHGFQSTPSFLINGEKLVGAQPIEKFREIIDKKLN